ncbi:MAG: glycosyltransferase [Bacillaceae bacterium]|nr:glycosyltransferase [Bacillaceae bacterium]
MSIHNEVNGYFVASEHLDYANDVYEENKSMFFPTGIPITDDGIHLVDREEIRSSLSLLKKTKTILIAGGGVGLANYTKLIETLESFEEKLQIICVTGHNKKAFEKLTRLKSKHSLRIIGFTNEFIKYLRASDVVITKAGGVTMAESLICETPALIFQPLPGQEEQNSQFLMNNGTAIKAEIVEEIPVLLKKNYF